MTNIEQQAEALGRARNGQALSNYPAIIQGFLDKGIPSDQIRPRENIFTYNAWLALGRQVRKGEHGVKVLTFIACKGKDRLDADGEAKEGRGFRRPWSTTVFHISQTDPKGEHHDA